MVDHKEILFKLLHGLSTDDHMGDVNNDIGYALGALGFTDERIQAAWSNETESFSHIETLIGER